MGILRTADGEILKSKVTWAKLARTSRGNVPRMSSETRHSITKPTMKDIRSEVMFCRITEILSAMADFTSVASVARRAATRVELCSSSSNQPTSFLRIAGRRRVVFSMNNNNPP